MERTGRTLMELSPTTRRPLGPVRAGWLLLAGALALGGCYIVPAQTAYVPPPGPVYVAPAPVYVAPAPVYVVPGYGWGGHGWRRYGRW